MKLKLSAFGLGGLLMLAVPGFAQSSAGSAIAVEHSIPFGTVPGKLLLLGKDLVFVDEQQLGMSFVVPKSAIESLTAEGADISVRTRESVRNRSGEVSRLSFRVSPGADPAVVTSWYGGGIAASPAPGGPAASSSAAAVDATIYQARHDHKIGECRGRLIVSANQLNYESVSNVSDSRRWEYSAIKETKLSNPYELEIKPFTGDTYKLHFDGEGMEPAAYKLLVDRITSARSSR